MSVIGLLCAYIHSIPSIRARWRSGGTPIVVMSRASIYLKCRQILTLIDNNVEITGSRFITA